MKWYLKALKKYAVFNGRASRKEYWLFYLFNLIIAFSLGIVVVMLNPDISSEELDNLGNTYVLAVLLPSLAVGWRRMHDTGRSGWWLFIPVISLLFLVEKGTEGRNRFGAKP